MPRIAAAAWPIDWHDDWDSYATKLATGVADAARAGAELLVFPEYGLMELASLGGADTARDLEASLHEVARHRDAVDALHADLARRHRVHILGASGPVFDGARPVNRATLFGPDGILGHQDKQIMTRFEAEEWDVRPGGPLRVFDTPLGRLGILICYDCEFPLLARALVDAGAELLLVPSATETHAGFSRVRIGAMARALENQCAVAHAPTVGAAPWCPAVDMNVGRAAIYGPPDRGWPETGILAESAMNTGGWAVADVNLDAIARVRVAGGVLNWRDWRAQAERLSHGVMAAQRP
ncbi:carbon-nitrogen hydrolase family protein [Rhodobaculum claviforme]|uniref:Amidohydrolase n=1 Tax=Rhodobaculum claviforme TaxID=1549854 RepID=A0A934TJS7_9RHOB|nr:carbon-nitrogen hydrolase family protein [Rhodobaculum claviforme]MBK5926502.1 amidohydrolase [Rhodobaculum claviforme]